MSPKTVYFVRHGQCEGNVAPVFVPLDSPLNEEGREQAERIAERIERIPFDLLVSSPLTRTKQTSEPIAKRTGKDILYSDLFVERVKPTGIAGKPYNDSEASQVWEHWQDSLYTPGLRVQDGENFDDIMARADAALAFLEDRPEEAIVVVTHGWFLRALFARVLLGSALTGDLLRRFQQISRLRIPACQS